MAEPMTEEQLVEAMAEAAWNCECLLEVDECLKISRAMLPFIQAAEARALEWCVTAVKSQALEDPDYRTDDEAYDRAICDALDAIRQLGTGEG